MDASVEPSPRRLARACGDKRDARQLQVDTSLRCRAGLHGSRHAWPAPSGTGHARQPFWRDDHWGSASRLRRAHAPDKPALTLGHARSRLAGIGESQLRRRGTDHPEGAPRVHSFTVERNGWRKAEWADSNRAPALTVTKAVSRSERQLPLARHCDVRGPVLAPGPARVRYGALRAGYRLVRAPSGSRVTRRVSGGRARVATGSGLSVERGVRTWASG
jgi:hypothetical protein